MKVTKAPAVSRLQSSRGKNTRTPLGCASKETGCWQRKRGTRAGGRKHGKQAAYALELKVVALHALMVELCHQLFDLLLQRLDCDCAISVLVVGFAALALLALAFGALGCLRRLRGVKSREQRVEGRAGAAGTA